MKRILFQAVLAAAIVTTAAAETYKMTTPIAPGVMVRLNW